MSPRHGTTMTLVFGAQWMRHERIRCPSSCAVLLEAKSLSSLGIPGRSFRVRFYWVELTPAQRH